MVRQKHGFSRKAPGTVFFDSERLFLSMLRISAWYDKAHNEPHKLFRSGSLLELKLCSLSLI